MYKKAPNSKTVTGYNSFKRKEWYQVKLIMSDKPLDLDLNREDVIYIDLSSLNIANCTGCFGCWTKTPGRCVIRDDAVKVYPKIAESDKLIYVSRVKYGGYDTIMKTMLERAIPIQQAFIRIVDGETHHVQRDVAEKDAVIVAYGDISEQERELFKRLIGRNARNMNFKSYNVIFSDERQVCSVVKDEVAKWEE